MVIPSRGSFFLASPGQVTRRLAPDAGDGRLSLALIHAQHLLELGAPFRRILAIAELMEIRSAERKVDERGVLAVRVVPDKMIPARRDFTDQCIILKPLELVQFEPGCRIH